MTVRVLHLTGSAVDAQFDDLSRLYARGCLSALADAPQFEPLIVHVDPSAVWRLPESLDDAALAEAEPLSPGAAVARVAALGVDVMVPHMFCVPGMTHYRALFDVLGIPYLGNAPEVMALTARKDLARQAVAAAGVAVPDAEVLGPGAVPSLAPPVVVKPVSADNSAGVTLVRDPDGLGRAVAGASAHGAAVLVEQFIAPGREVRCGILVREGVPVCLPLEEYPVDAVVHPIRTAADKLARDGHGELELVAKSVDRAWIVPEDDPIVPAVWEAARRCHRALGCRHYSLFDFRIDPAGRPWFLEAGLYCSYSPQSVVATMAAAAGIGVVELFTLGVAEALGANSGVGAGRRS